MFRKKRLHEADLLELQKTVINLVRQLFDDFYAPALRVEVEKLRQELRDIKELKQRLEQDGVNKQ
jgi:hypothetical protein